MHSDNETVEDIIRQAELREAKEGRPVEYVTAQSAPEPVAEAPASEVAYPEHDKLTKVQDKSQVIGEFIEWLGSEKKVFLAETVNERGLLGQESITYCRTNIQQLLAEFFEIDWRALNAEKDAIYDTIRLSIVSNPEKYEVTEA